MAHIASAPRRSASDGQTPCLRCATHYPDVVPDRLENHHAFQTFLSEKPCWCRKALGRVQQAPHPNRKEPEYLPCCLVHRAATTADAKRFFQEVCVPQRRPTRCHRAPQSNCAANSSQR